MNHVHGGAPWTRDAIRQFEHRYPEAAAELDAAVPAGHDIVLTAVNGQKGLWGTILRNEDGIVARDAYGCPTVASACYRVLRLARKAA